MHFSADTFSSMISRGRAGLVLPLVFCFLTSCTKESQYQADQLPEFPAQTILISEPVVYSWARMLSESDDHLIYLPPYQFNTLNLNQDSRRSVVNSASTVILYSPDYSEEFNEYFSLDETHANISTLKSEDPSLSYPYILPQVAKEDISALAEILKAQFPQEAESIRKSEGDIFRQMDELENQRHEILSNFPSDLQIIVESQTMAEWLKNPKTGISYFDVTVIRNLQGQQTEQSIKDLNAQIKSIQPDLIITADYASRTWLQEVSAEIGTPVFHLETIDEGVTSERYYLDVMERNINLLTLSLINVSE